MLDATLNSEELEHTRVYVRQACDLIVTNTPVEIGIEESWSESEVVMRGVENKMTMQVRTVRREIEERIRVKARKVTREMEERA
ncbi:hypothetical protein AMTR_s00018p00080710 [Amborella trichopoda]|uniref:Uncharacterized protein n=1 Tax=Amborella trichopoda TaxID=13333 RepID=W1PLU6_AMBTC|nr:hypothetical protein AMTR_s00018p00080710 [Amborella trichopoda]